MTGWWKRWRAASPSVGWAAGVERLALLLDAGGLTPAAPRPVAVIPVGEAAEGPALDVAQALRRAGVATEMAYKGNLRRRMERANRSGARAAVIIGEAEWRRARRAPRSRRGHAGNGVVGRGAGATCVSVADKLERVLTRVEEMKHLLATTEGGQFGALSKELSELEPVAEKVQVLRAAERARDEAEAMLADRPELRELAEAEYFEQRDWCRCWNASCG